MSKARSVFVLALAQIIVGQIQYLQAQQGGTLAKFRDPTVSTDEMSGDKTISLVGVQINSEDDVQIDIRARCNLAARCTGARSDNQILKNCGNEFNISFHENTSPKALSVMWSQKQQYYFSGPPETYWGTNILERNDDGQPVNIIVRQDKFSNSITLRNDSIFEESYTVKRVQTTLQNGKNTILRISKTDPNLSSFLNRCAGRSS